MSDGFLIGFAALSPEDRKLYARRGGLTIQHMGNGYRWDAVSASAAAHKVKDRGGWIRKRREAQERHDNV